MPVRNRGAGRGRLLDEMLAEHVPADVYEKTAKAYRAKREQAESRLVQLEVDYDDPLEFLDKCSRIAGMLSYLHHRFNFEQRKNLVQIIFRRIDVQDRAIVGVELNPPFSMFFEKQVRKLFKHPPTSGTKQEDFEQIVRFTLSSQYEATQKRVGHLVESMTRNRFTHVRRAGLVTDVAEEVSVERWRTPKATPFPEVRLSIYNISRPRSSEGGNRPRNASRCCSRSAYDRR